MRKTAEDRVTDGHLPSAISHNPATSSRREVGSEMLRVTDAIVVHDREMEEQFVRASGPGGQNVNKVTTAVELRFDIGRSSLPADMKERLIKLGGKRVTAGGVLLIDSREHRTQSQNREAARERLLALLQRAARRPKARRPTKPRAGAREKRLASKKMRSAVKAQRGRGGQSED
jgi:ribosome-associated protein